MANFKQNHLRASALTALAASIFIAFPAAAQDATLPTVRISDRNAAPTADLLGLGDAPLSRTPASVTVFGAELIEASGAKRLADLIRFDSSVSDAYNSAGYWDYLTVRGFVLDNKYNFRREGLPISAETSIGLENKNRVEILKGTSGIQAGTSAPGGLVNYVVKRPTENDLRSVRLELDQRGSVLAAADLGGRFGTDRAFGYRFNVAAENIQSYADNNNGKRQLVALATDWRLSRDSVLEAEIEYSRRSQPSVTGLSLTGNTLPAPNPRLNTNNQPWVQPVVLEGLTGTVKFEQALSPNWRWSAQAGTQRLKSDDRTAFPFGCSDANGVDYYADRFCPDGSYDLYDYRSDNERRTTSAAQIQIKGKLDMAGIKHDIGFALLRSRTHDRFQRQAYNYVGTGNLATLPAFDPVPDLTGDNTNRSETSTELSAYNAITWSNRFSTWLGLRHTRLSRNSIRTNGVDATSYDRNITTPWLAATFELTAGQMVYASYGQGVESEVAPGRARYTNAGQPLDALKSRQVEIGLKGRQNAVHWTAALFSITRPLFADVGSCDIDNSCTRQVDGDQQHRGIELSAGTETGPWSFEAGTTVLNAKRKGSSNPALNGKRPVNVPDYIVRAQAEYRVASVPGMRLQAHVSHEAQRSVLPDESITLPAWTRVDAALRYETRIQGTRTTWTLGVDNLFDRRYFKESPYQFSHVYLFPGAPRTVRFTVQASL